MQDNLSSSSTLQIDPKVYIAYVLRYWYLVLIGLMGAMLYAYYQVRYTPATYSTNARMLVKDEYSSWGQEYFLPGMELVSGRNRLVNEIGIIRSFPLMERVARKLDIPYSYYKVGNIKTTEMYPRGDFSVSLSEGERIPGAYFIDFPKEGFYRIHSSEEELKKAPEQRISEPLKIGESSYNLK